MEMLCRQCEQSKAETGCVKVGVCGKPADVSALQDLLVITVRGISKLALAAGAKGVDLGRAEAFVEDAMFATLTNVDFSAETISAHIDEGIAIREELRAGLVAAGESGEFAAPCTTLNPPADLDERIALAAEIGSPWDTSRDEDVVSLQETTIYGIKGLAAYAHHARRLGQSDPAVGEYIFRAMDAIGDKSLELGDWLELALEAGKVNLRVMELLDAANTGAYGTPVPTKVPLGHRPNKAILVSGHDLLDLHELLKQTEGKGIDIYTHGEMLPTHGYPELKKYPHFYGHYGTAWQNQKKEFVDFPGAILMTTNCLMIPSDSYKENLFNSGLVSFDNVPHVDHSDFSAVIERALELPGFTDEVDNGFVNVGFGHGTVLGVADTVIDAVKSGAIKHFFLVGGCDGARPGRNYYTDFVDATPSDTIVLTLACGKYRFFDHDLGEIGGLPRLMDMGQCNDAYSAIRVAVALAEAFDTDVNSLPLSIVLSWYEQKAVAVLLTLLYLGIKDMRLGPTLPQFISPNVLNVLVENYGLTPIGEDAAADVAALLAS